MIVKGSDTSGELGHWSEVNQHLLSESLVKEDDLLIIASSHDHCIILDIDNLPKSICVRLMNLSNGSSIPDGQFSSGRPCQESLLLEGKLAGDERLNASCSIDSLIYSHIDALDRVEFDMLEADSGELSLALPARIKDSIGVGWHLAQNGL